MVPTGAVTTMAGGSWSVATLAVARVRKACPRADSGRAKVARLAGDAGAGMVDRTGAASALPAVWLSRIEWSIRSRSTGTPERQQRRHADGDADRDQRVKAAPG